MHVVLQMPSRRRKDRPGLAASRGKRAERVTD